MATNKTVATKASVDDFVNKIPFETMRDDARTLIVLITKESGWKPFMYGSSIIGFGLYRYTYPSGHSGEAPYIAFASRGKEMNLYLESVFDQRDELLAEFGKHRKTKTCVYFKRLQEMNLAALKKLIKASLAETIRKYPVGKA